jgi:hypothetical protein
MIKKRRPATSGQEREALIKMAADESELSRRTGNYKEQSTAGTSARVKKYIEPVVETTLNVTSLGGLATGAAKMIPTIVKGVKKLLTPRNAAKAVGNGTGRIAPTATNAEREALKKARDATKVGGNSTGKPKENIYEESKRTVDRIPPASDAGRPFSPGGVQTTPKPKPKPTPVSSRVPTGAKVVGATVAASPLLVPNEDEIRRSKERQELEKQIDEEAKAMGLPPVKRTKRGIAAAGERLQDQARERKEKEKAQETRSNIPNTAPREGEPGSASNPKYVGPPPKVTPLKNEDEAKDKKPKSSFDSEPDPREDPSAWRKWNFKRVKAAEKAGVKPESIAKSSMDKEISERNMYDVSDKKGGRIKTSPKVKRAVGGMVKPKKKTSSPRGAGCAERGYGKAMMGGGKVKAYKAGGKVGGNRLY